jgi:hypothetical protein
LSPFRASASTTCFNTVNEIQSARQNANDRHKQELTQLLQIISAGEFQGSLSTLFRRYDLYSTIKTTPSDIRLDIYVPGTNRGKKMPIYICVVPDGFEAVNAADPSQKFPFRAHGNGLVIKYQGADIVFSPIKKAETITSDGTAD